MKAIKIFSGLLLLSIFLSGCESNNDSNNNQSSNFSENFGASVSRDFIGQVVDIDNNPLQNVTIKIGSTTVQTDVNGVFIINSASVYEKFAYITAKKLGYIDGSRSMVPTSGKNNVRIMLFPNAPLQTIQSGETSEVTIYSGTKVVFDGAFQDETGANYTGDVQVSLFHLTPSDENISKLMPGMLYAERESGEAAVLETFGMLNVELRGSAGQKLNIKTGHTAEITIRIDDNQLATAPATIPLWHFDEQNGYWKEEGIATKVGNKYVGNVNHFSWWNCDAPFPTVALTVNVVDANGNPNANIGVGLIANGINFPVMGYTDDEGQVSGLIPSNQSLILNVYDGVCGVIYSSTIGPFSANTTLPNIVITDTGSILSSNIIGSLLKCDNTNVTNGYVILNRYGNYSVSPVTNGSFSFNEIYCSSNTEFTLKGVDYNSIQQTDLLNYNFISTITNVGNLQACNAVNEFISYQIDNNPTVFLVGNVAGNYSQNILTLNGSSPTGGLYIWGNTIIPGNYTTAQFSIEGSGVGYISSSTNNTIEFHLNQFGEVDEYIDMTFSGTFSNPDGNHAITGVAHVIRDN